MYVAYLATTILAALANGYAASLNFAGAESVVLPAAGGRRRWRPPSRTATIGDCGELSMDEREWLTERFEQHRPHLRAVPERLARL